MRSAMLEIKHLTIQQQDQVLMERLSLQVASGAIATLAGASGSGKSTLLSYLVGDLDPAFEATGELWLNSERLDGLPIQARGVGILFQDDWLFPHWSVGQNLAFALPAAVRGAAARRDRVEQALSDVGMAGFHDRDPLTLSGGQRARVSLMRALLAQPRALLLDEPFSKLDASLRSQFRQWVFEQITRLGIPTVMVTHDPADAPQGGQMYDIQQWKPHRV